MWPLVKAKPDIIPSHTLWSFECRKRATQMVVGMIWFFVRSHHMNTLFPTLKLNFQDLLLMQFVVAIIINECYSNIVL